MIFLDVMGNGIHSTIEPLKVKLVKRWCPKWYDAFADHSLGGYFERLNRNFKPLQTGQRRLVSQCRQLSIYSHLSAQKSSYFKQIKDHFDFIVEYYHDPKTGHWWFALDDNVAVKDRYSDLYGICFVIFSFSHYYRATKDERAKDLALQTLHFVNKAFRLPGLPGLAEAVGAADGQPLSKMRRQNPHMHLLEACLFAHETWGGTEYLAMADDMVGLFYDYFFDRDHSTVCEFFTDDLKPHPVEGRKIEPGHAFEWVWLLKKHAKAHDRPDKHDESALQLLQWANRYGWDEKYGGIYDVLDPSGAVITETKRIWPFCEALKANTLMLNDYGDRQWIKDRVAEMVTVFNDKFMDDRGFWTEWLTRDLRSVTDYMPATTPYHVYFGIMETADILEARGGSKSISSKIKSNVYAFRRDLSLTLKKAKASLRGR